MSDEAVPAGELVLTSGGDGIFPKGLLVGRVTKVAPGSELFLNIRVRPAADLSKLEEVLVVTKIDERQAQPDQAGAARAVDILAERLPTVPSKPENAAKADTPGPATPGTVAPKGTGSEAKPKAVSPEASAGSGMPAMRKTASSPSFAGAASGTSSGTSAETSVGTPSGNAATATGTPATKVSPKPVKAKATTMTTDAPKPQPAVEDTPH
jgi:rod shape-determining protein MreC